MAKTSKKFSKTNDTPLTLGGLVEYTHEVLLPAMDERFATKKDVSDLKTDVSDLKFGLSDLKTDASTLRNDFDKFRDESLTRHDDIIKKLDILIEEKEVADYQHEKQKRFFLIITKALKDRKILNQTQLKQIAELEIF
jgi:hypothetical protein